MQTRGRSVLHTAARRSGAAGVLFAAWLLASVPAAAVSFYLSPDVPTDLGGVMYLPSEVVRHDSGLYASQLTLPAGTAVDALYRMDGGDWLLSVGSPADLGGTRYMPEDVVRYDGASYSMFFDGSLRGVAAGTDVDAVFLAGGDAGDLILSFDVPMTLGAETYLPADLVAYVAGGFSLFFDASAASPPIPSSTNVVGASRQGGLTILTFDVPTTLGGTTHLPGDLVSWDGAALAPFHSDPAWPPGSRVDALSFLAGPGRTPTTLLVDKSSATPGDLTIRWSPSCSSGAEDYGIYEGQLGEWYSHTRIDCFDDGADLAEDVTPSPGDRYYLVVPSNPNDEGSYGIGRLGTERPVGAFVCVASQSLAPCP